MQTTLTDRSSPMGNSLHLQHRIEILLNQTLPAMRKTRHRNLARLVTGLYRAGHVHLSDVADKLAGSAQQTSKTRRLRRFLANEAVKPDRWYRDRWYRPVARQLLQEAAAGDGPLRLLIDTLELTGERRLLVAALAYRRRALPIRWRVDRTTGVTGADLQQHFVERLADLVPSGADVALAGDGEFHSVDLLRAARRQGWTFCVRLHADTYVRRAGRRRWRECQTLDPVEGGRRYVEDVYITKEHDFGPVHLVYHWEEGEEAPWRLVTNRRPGFSVYRLYQRRMWIEELFGDWQDGGFHLNQTRLYRPDRLSRLVLGLSLVYVWLVAVASYVVKRGWRPLIDRTDRRDRSYFAIGYRWIQRCLRNRRRLQVRLQPYF